MPNINERPVCHRAEDLVTYLYGEASETDATDFAGHLQECDACRTEFGGFQQVHDSMLTWRNDALGSAFNAPPVSAAAAVESTQLVQHERKLSALAALREFFSVSPLWLRAATAFAALLLCVLGGLTIARVLNRPVQLETQNTEPKYSQQDIEQALQRQREELAKSNGEQTVPKVIEEPPSNKATESVNRPQLAADRAPTKASRTPKLSRQEREQLAKDLRLIPRDEDELPFGLSEEPNQ